MTLVSEHIEHDTRERILLVIAARPGPAAARLRELITTIHRMNSERYVGDAKLHEMVEIAMEESWEVCVAHMERITETIGRVIAEVHTVRPGRQRPRLVAAAKPPLRAYQSLRRIRLHLRRRMARRRKDQSPRHHRPRLGKPG